jgi:hypothetical protein
MTLGPTEEDAATPTAKPEQPVRPVESAQRRKQIGFRIAPAMLLCS